MIPATNNTAMRDKMLEAMERKAEPWPQRLPIPGKTGSTYFVSTTGFNRKSNAERAAHTWCRHQRISNPQQGRDYKLVHQSQGWAWHPPSKMPPVPLVGARPVNTVDRPTDDEPRQKRAYKANRLPMFSATGHAKRQWAQRSVSKYLKRQGVEAREGVHYMLRHEADQTWTWLLPPFDQPNKEPPVPTAEAVAPTAYNPDNPPPSQASSSPATRLPTRDQRRAILDALDSNYDSDAQRYRGDMSDAKLSERLNLPRAWVAQFRADVYGDYDRNERSDADARRLDEAIALAGAAVERLTNMAVEAEKLMNDLKAARQRLA